ncbi:MAG: 3-hydroxyacyl-CoA dehydrogenase/enoyl-CoA hydratase family protein, partial [Fidelibacterota bacterium]
QEGISVIMMDREDRFLEKGINGIRATLKEGVERKIFTPEKCDEILNRITQTTEMNDLAVCDLIIEAVFEDLSVKQDLFTRLLDIVPEETILATNTSSFSVTELAGFVKNPRRFLGLHFFYHAAKNRLVEIVKGKDTDDSTFQSCKNFMQKSGKDPIVCKDANGFVVNRFFVPWLNESVRIYEEGIANPAEIDLIACKTFGCGMGPFALMNATGVPIAYHAQKTLENAFGKFYSPAEALEKQAELNQPWEISEPMELQHDTAQKISSRLRSVVIFVCGQILDEKICSAGDISRGAGVGLRWRKTPIDLYFNLGKDGCKEEVAQLTTKWQIHMPASMSEDCWIPDHINTEIIGETGLITINRPEGLNAMNPLVVTQLAEAFDSLDSNPHISTIAITGTGKAFVAGADIKFFIDHIKNRTISEIVKFTTEGQALFSRIDHSKKKVMAVINGLALGGGLELALTADLIVAYENAVFAFPETGIGIYPGLGGTQRTTDRIGIGLTKYLIYTGQMLNAKTALEIGLVDKVISGSDAGNLSELIQSTTRSKPNLSGRWNDIIEFFNRYTVYKLMNTQLTAPPGMEKTLKIIRTKAPIAMQLSERLINDQKGPESELSYLSDLFRTKDALTGLQSVGKKPPVYKGY